MIFSFEWRKKIKHGSPERKTVVRLPFFSKARVLGTGSQHLVNEDRFGANPVKAREYRVGHSGKHTLTLAKKELGKEASAHAYEAYRRCREAGLPVPVTYGVEDDGWNATMTDLTRDGKFNVESSTDMLRPVRDKIKMITNLPELAKRIAWASVLAEASHIRLELSDVPLFRFPKGGGDVPVDFAILDYQYLQWGDSSSAESCAQQILTGFERWLPAHERDAKARIAATLKEQVAQQLPICAKIFADAGTADAFRFREENGIIRRTMERVKAS